MSWGYRGLKAARVGESEPATQDNVGTALLKLGQRESETAKLEEAVMAYREALKERTRERVPLLPLAGRDRDDCGLLATGNIATAQVRVIVGFHIVDVAKGADKEMTEFQKKLPPLAQRAS